MPERGKEDELSEAVQKKSKLRIWCTEIRAPFLTATMVPIVLGTAIAWAVFDEFNWLYFILAFIGGLFIHIGTNVANDYFDHRSRNDELNRDFVRPFTGGSRMIQLGLLTPREVLAGALFFFAMGIAIGLYFAWKVGIIILILGVIGVFSGFFYTSPPVNLASRGIGEFFVGLNFGILMTLGAFYVQTAVLTWEPLLAAVPVALLIAAVLYINQFQDYKADKAVGKDHLVVRLGKKKAVIGYAALMLFTYVSVILFVVLKLISVYTLLILLSLPLVIQGIHHARKFYSKSIELAPTNAITVMSHLIIGVLLITGYIFEKVGNSALIYIVPTIILFSLIIILFYRSIEKQKKALLGVGKSAG